MTLHLTHAAEGLERLAFTISDLERMVEAGILDHKDRVELIGGELVPMSAKGSRHEGLKVALTSLWGRTCPAGFLFAQETALRLDRHTYLEPDFIVFSRMTRLADVKGPDVLLVVEVADSSLDYDLRRKSRVYAAFGVRELWVVDAARGVTHRHLDVGPAGYATVTQSGAEESMIPRFAPAELAFTLDGLDQV